MTSQWRVQWSTGGDLGQTEEHPTEQRAEERAAELVRGGVRYVCVYGVDAA